MCSYVQDFSLRNRVQNGSGDHPASYPMSTRGFLPGDKAAGAWSWPLTSIQYLRQECAELYIRSPNTPSWRVAQLKNSTGATLPSLYHFNTHTE
jgi:hypothetical protein